MSAHPKDVPINLPPPYRCRIESKEFRSLVHERVPKTVTFNQVVRKFDSDGSPVPLPRGILIRDIRAHRQMPRYLVADAADRPLDIFVRLGISYIVIAIWVRAPPPLLFDSVPSPSPGMP